MCSRSSCNTAKLAALLLRALTTNSQTGFGISQQNSPLLLFFVRTLRMRGAMGKRAAAGENITKLPGEKEGAQANGSVGGPLGLASDCSQSTSFTHPPPPPRSFEVWKPVGGTHASFHDRLIITKRRVLSTKTENTAGSSSRLSDRYK